MKRLVSYQDDTIISDNERFTESEDEESESSEEETPNLENQQVVEAPIVEANDKLESEICAQYKFKIPAKPMEKPSASLVEKITNLYEKMETKNMDMNKLIQERKEFRNPSIYEKLIEFCDIDEFGSNYPLEVYDPNKWRNTEMSTYLQLAEAQNKKEKERKTLDAAKIPTSDDIPK